MTTAGGGAAATRPSFAGWFVGSGDSKSSALLLVPCCIAIAACLLIPLAYVLALSFNPARPGEVELTGTVTFSNYARLFLNWFYLRVLLKTVWIAGLTTFLCGVFGIVLALAIWRSSRRAHGFIVIVVLSPLLVSIVTRTFGWMVVLGDNGVINATLLSAGLIREPLHMMFTDGTVIVGLVHVFLPLMVLSVLTSLDRIDPSIPEAANTLGAGPFTAFREVILPLLTPGLTAGVTIVFSLAMSSYVTPALMGGTDSGMLTTLIYQQFVVTYNWHFGAVLVTVLLATSLSILGLVLAEHGRRTRTWMTRR
jgi:putative spermidine/putrescine transport system permease protein